MKTHSAFGAVSALALSLAAWGQAGLPSGASVGAGSASFASTANSMTVTTGSNRTIINYNSFSVGTGNSVQFLQPSSSSATLNRVIGSEGSSILGSVTSNGQIFLVNPNGIFVGPGGSFSASSVYLSTGNISNADFLGGNVRFDPPPSGSTIRVAGGIDATNVLQLNASAIETTGTLNAHGGSLILNTGPTSPIQTLLQPVTVASGSAVIASGSTVASVTIQNSNLAIFNWDRFTIGPSLSVNFIQPSSGSIVLNRVSGDPTAILGRITSNGKVWLITSNGIILSPTKVVPVPAIKLASASVPTVLPVAAPAALPPLSRPTVASMPRGTAGLVDGTVTVRMSLVDAGPIALR